MGEAKRRGSFDDRKKQAIEAELEKSVQFTNDQYQDLGAEANKKIDELTAEVERLKTVPMKYRRMQFNAELQDENHELRKQLAIAEEHNARLREAWNAIEVNSEECLDFDECTAMLVLLDDYNAMSDTLSIPASREAFDKYVAEKVKEETDEYAALSDRLAKLLAETAVALKGEEAALTRHSWHDLPVIALAKMVEISELTKQRDLAVKALQSIPIGYHANIWGKVCTCGRCESNRKVEQALSTIKESGEPK